MRKKREFWKNLSESDVRLTLFFEAVLTLVIALVLLAWLCFKDNLITKADQTDMLKSVLAYYVPIISLMVAFWGHKARLTNGKTIKETFLVTITALTFYSVIPIFFFLAIGLLGQGVDVYLDNIQLFSIILNAIVLVILGIHFTVPSQDGEQMSPSLIEEVTEQVQNDDQPTLLTVPSQDGEQKSPSLIEEVTKKAQKDDQPTLLSE